jgi:hypothetical protein
VLVALLWKEVVGWQWQWCWWWVTSCWWFAPCCNRCFFVEEDVNRKYFR